MAGETTAGAPCSTLQAMADLALAGYAEAERERILGTLFSWLRIPSISADPERAGDVRASAEFCAGLLRQAGLEHVDRARDRRRAGGLRRLAARRRRRRRPCWSTATTTCSRSTRSTSGRRRPFDPVIVDGECLARGAIDDKGQTLYQIEAARGLLAEHGRLAGQPQAPHRGRGGGRQPPLRGACWSPKRPGFACDVVVVSDTGMIAPDVPVHHRRHARAWSPSTWPCGPPRIDLHSGMWGGTVPNAARVAARLAAALHDDAGPGHPARLLRRGSGPEPGREGVAGRPALRRGGVPGRGRRGRLPRGRGGLHAPRADRRPTDGRGRRAPRRLRRPGHQDHRAGHRRASRWPSGWCPTSGPTRSTPPSGPGWPSGCRAGVALAVTPEGGVAPGPDPGRPSGHAAPWSGPSKRSGASRRSTPGRAAAARRRRWAGCWRRRCCSSGWGCPATGSTPPTSGW